MAWDTSPRHGTNWKPKGYAKLRARRFAAYGNHCIECPATEHLELDHLDGNRNNWAPTNLAPRCRPCHARKTQAEAQAARAKRSARRDPEPHPGLRVGGTPQPPRAGP